jgi:hypothetical protein
MALRQYQKYKNKRVEFDGLIFDSLKEKRRYCELQILQKQGIISDLRLQVPYELLPAIYEDVTIQLKTKTKTKRKLVQRATTYVADFVYTRDGKEVVEDTKGFRTKEYELKKKMMRSLLGIEIQEL